MIHVEGLKRRGPFGELPEEVETPPAAADAREVGSPLERIGQSQQAREVVTDARTEDPRTLTDDWLR